MMYSLKIVSMWLCLGLIGMVSHADDAEFLPVDQAFSYEHQIDNNQLTITFDIRDGYYLYLSRLSLKQNGQALAFNTKQSPVEKEDEFFGKVRIFKHALELNTKTNGLGPITLGFQGCAEAGLCYPPQTKIITLTNAVPSVKDTPTSTAEINTSDASSITVLLQSGNVFWQMLIFFALGVGLAFTPCVFPMIPILSSIIVGQGASLTTRNAFVMSLTYVVAMATAYALAGVIVGYFGAKANVQLYLQNPWVLGSFAAVFVALSLSMFGFYELQLPRYLQDKLNNLNQRQQGGQLISVAIMGVLSALVVSPCVSAPLAGTLVYISTTGDALLGGAALLSLGLGMGLPLLLIGTGGSRFLPKAGTWMKGVKNVFGVALLGVAIWLVERVIPASITMMLWASLLIGSGVFLGAFEQNTKTWSRLFKAMGLLLSFYGALLVIGVASGNTNPLQPLSGARPVTSHSISNVQIDDKTHHRITHRDEFQTLLNQAQQNQQITILDFYADWCIACKVMDAEIFSQADVQQKMHDAVFIQLDMTDNTEDQLSLLSEFGLFGPPAVLFFHDGHELTDLRIVGEVNKRTFVSQLQKAQTSLTP